MAIGGRERRHAETADEIGRARNTEEVVENRPRLRQVVDQHHGVRTVGAIIEAKRGPLPEHTRITGIPRIEGPFAVPQTADEGAARFLAQNIAIRQAPLAYRFLDNGGEPVRDAAEEVMAGIDNLV